MTAYNRNTSGRVNGRKRPRGYASWAPRAETQVLLEQVNEVLAEYAEHLPLTVRQVFYRLVGGYDYPKTEAAYANLADKLVRARRAKLISFNDLRDDGVSVIDQRWFDSPADFWDDTGRRVRRYQRDRQQGQPQRIELWCEAAGMMPQLARVANIYSVPVFSSGGFMSLTAIRHIVDRAVTRDQPTVILHVGDLDPSGVAVFDHMTEDVQAFVEQDRIVACTRVDCCRVALTETQVETFALPTAPTKKSDGRSGSWKGETCQLEALAPDDLAWIIQVAIEGLLNVDRFDREVAAEQLDMTEIRALLPGGAS